MSWFWTVIFLTFAFINTSESRLHHHHNPSAVIVGTVYCDTCFRQDLPRASQYFIAGASVAVECKDTGSGTSFRQEVKTDSHGEFKVHLPFPVSKHIRKIRGCYVRLISSNKPYCAVAASATSSNLHLKSRKDGTHVFSAGFFTFRPLKQPQVCDQKPSINNFKNREEKLSQISNPNDPAFLPPVQDPPSDPPSLGSFLPPLPRLPPLPQLPRLPPLPGIPFLPPVAPKKQAAANKVPKLSESVVNQPANTLQFPPISFNLPSLFPPNPFQSSPSILPPIFTSPSPSIFPPLFPSPPLFNLPPLPPLPPLPGFISSPPTPPSLANLLPKFPFQPTPGLPGVPAPKVSSPSETTSP
ncbi:Pollen Ole e 1 allergen and extensin family protein [Perilla frutescens var. hirtella]|uniref:Pollen Ole e 1 allergen and extensin family protein n=1 Tax=Perilla frutescens var. hirtella TaxID=608512 RepID=A0AAD4P7D7_PERFH|nr:Pollen Ole e 1 allergen and extensin family protein [Perilla frutescens var. hirtella]